VLELGASRIKLTPSQTIRLREICIERGARGIVDQIVDEQHAARRPLAGASNKSGAKR
jgi:hypothetical protein